MPPPRATPPRLEFRHWSRNVRSRPRWLIVCSLLAVAALLAGCGLLRKPDMSHTASIAALRPPQRPLIFIPGFLGTKLKDPVTGEVVWGTMANILTGGDSENLALAIGPGDVPAGERVEAYAIYDSLWGIEYYREILRSLRTAGGYTLGDIDAPKPGDNAFVFLYDWRRDNVESAQRLARAIERLALHYGDPDQKFDLLAHSQGGLIARYYIKYGGAPLTPEGETPRPTMAGARNTGKVVMMGTPNRGCLEALKVLHLGLKKLFRPIRPEVVFTMPAVYQMLPPPEEILFASATGEPIPLDLYDAATWEREGLSFFSAAAQERMREARKKTPGGADTAAFNATHRAFLARTLSSARRFQEALDAPAAGEEAISYYAFGSDCNPTLRAAVIVEKNGKRDFHFDEDALPREGLRAKLAKLFYGPGDGKVLMRSLLAIPEKSAPESQGEGTMEFKTAFFVCDDHGVLPNNPIFQNNLLYLLLRDETAPAGKSLTARSGD